MYRVATMFSGGGIVETAIHQFKELGLVPALAIEGDPDNQNLSRAIADNYALNFPNVMLVRKPVQQIKYQAYAGDWFLLHASPSCKSFSAANIKSAGETNGDVAAAEAILRAIAKMRPQYFTLEQVRGYRHTACFAGIMQLLTNLDYKVTVDVVNAKDYGVPQSRERLILIASRHGFVGLPARQRPVCWSDALGARLNQMAIAQPTDAQLLALRNVKQRYQDTKQFLIQRVGGYTKLKVKHPYEQCFTITAQMFTDDKGSSRKSFLNIWHDGAWLDLTVRDCAILQSIPDWYQLPESSYIGGAIVGNAVPTNLYRAILKQIVRHAKL